MDNLTEKQANALRVIDEEHAVLHEGRHFFASDVSLAIALSASVTYLLRTDGASPHFKWEVNCDGGLKVDIYESSVVSANGTTVPVYNRNRTSANTSGVLVTKGPTVTSSGTQLFTTGSTSKSGRLQVSSSEFILKPSTNYTVVLTAFSNNVNAAVLLDWYELGY